MHSVSPTISKHRFLVSAISCMAILATIVLGVVQAPDAQAALVGPLAGKSPGTMDEASQPTVEPGLVTITWHEIYTNTPSSYQLDVFDFGINNYLPSLPLTKNTSMQITLPPGGSYRWDVSACMDNGTGCGGRENWLFFRTAGTASVQASSSQQSSACDTSWQCSWGTCINGRQALECHDRNQCPGAPDKPDDVRNCDSAAAQPLSSSSQARAPSSSSSSRPLVRASPSPLPRLMSSSSARNRQQVKGATSTKPLEPFIKLIEPLIQSVNALNAPMPIPIIQGNLSPNVAAPGTAVTIKGKNFLPEQALFPTKVLFFFGGVNAKTREAQIISIHDSEIVVTVPVGTGKASVFVDGPGGKSKAVPFTYALPVIDTTNCEVPITNPADPKGLIVITHGLDDNANSRWIFDMRKAITDKVDQKKWDIMTCDWSKDAALGRARTIADLGASAIFNRADEHGRILGGKIATRNYNQFHFIAHSAGTILIQSAMSEVRYQLTRAHKPVKTYMTFLDAYAPDGLDSLYGMGADYAEQYFDTRRVGVWWRDFTNTKLRYAYNFDVTQQAPPGSNNLSGAASHGWPIDWYIKSIQQSKSYGFLSPEDARAHLPKPMAPGELYSFPRKTK